MLPQAADSRARPRIGRYLITGRIGRGGMGMVYRGLDEALEREVAVKTLNAEGSLDADSRRRFEVEAKAAARLQHPNIVTVFELGEDRGLPFIAMEMLPGADLEALLRSGDEMPLTEKLDVVAQVCRGLAYAHERGIVHRDIKPSNVRLLEDGTAKIMDFGIAKLGGTHLTKTGMMVGTVHYMSPEQVRGKPLDGRSDVFSAGVILYELLAGERPFRGEGATQVLYKIVNEEPPPPDLAALGALGPKLQVDTVEGPRQGPGRPLPGGRRARRRPGGRARGGAEGRDPDPRPGGGGARRRPRGRSRGPRGRSHRPASRARRRAPGVPRGAPRAAGPRPRAEAEAPAGRGRAGGLPGARGHLPGRAHAPRVRHRAPADRRRLLDRHARRAGAGRRSGAAVASLALGRLAALVGVAAVAAARAAPRERPEGARRGAPGRALAADGRVGPRRRARHRRRHERRAGRARPGAGAGGAHLPQGRPPRRDAQRAPSAARRRGGLGHAAGRGQPRCR